jgi:glycosyltransferase involved in cell wall biosynthesis
MLSVIIPAYNEEAYIKRCIDSVLKQDTDYDFEVIVVDNNSTDDTPDLLKEYQTSQEVNVVLEKRQGVFNARNAGAEVAKGDILVFIDADCKLPRNHLQKIGDLFKKNPEIDAVGGLPHYSTLPPVPRILLYKLQIAYLYTWLRRVISGAWFLCGGNLAVSKRAFLKSDGFAHKIPGDVDSIKHNVFPEDVVFSMRLDEKGFNVKFSPKLLVRSSDRRKNDSLKNHLFRLFYDSKFVIMYRIQKISSKFRQKHSSITDQYYS